MDISVVRVDSDRLLVISERSSDAAGQSRHILLISRGKGSYIGDVLVDFERLRVILVVAGPQIEDGSEQIRAIAALFARFWLRFVAHFGSTATLFGSILTGCL